MTAATIKRIISYRWSQLAFLLLLSVTVLPVLLCTGAFVFWIVFDPYGEPPKAIPPLYRNAIGAYEIEYDYDQTHSSPRRVLTFHTADTLATVREYYVDYMQQADWSYYAEYSKSSINSFYKYFHQDSVWNQTSYKVEIEARQVSPQRTRVQISMWCPYYGWDGESVLGAQK